MLRSLFVSSPVWALLALLPVGGPVEPGTATDGDPCPTAAAVLPGHLALIEGLLSTRTPADPCPRPAAGSVVRAPPDLYSSGGVLTVEFDYFTTTDADGRTLYCFETPDGLEGPTLHVRPGDVLDLTLRNRVPAQPFDANGATIATASTICGAARATLTSVNLHYHGTNTSPACHADGVIHTIVNSGQAFRYRLKFPKDEPPGLYWYHPHLYGLAEAAVQGGATGAIVVEGIENLEPEVSGLRERVLVVRDQTVAGNPAPGGPVPSWDVSLNYVPIPYPRYTPATIRMRPGEREFWRLANTASDTILDVEVQYDGIAQPLDVVALDGVPVDSQDGRRRGGIIRQRSILIPPAGRAEFIVTGPSVSVRNATLLTRRVDTGPVGDDDPARPLATIAPSRTSELPRAMPYPSGPANPQRFEGLDAAVVTAHRKLYFSEMDIDQKQAWGFVEFFITVDGAEPKVFEPDEAPAVTTRQGAVEDWTIENRAQENHEFHIHQLHFEVLARNGKAVPAAERQFRDTIQIPYWSGSGPYPSVTLRLDFRGADVGDFVYHCHILGHEDRGMMAVIRVLPKS